MQDGKRGRRTTVGGGANAKYEVRGTKYEVENWRNSVARDVAAKPERMVRGEAVGACVANRVSLLGRILA